MSVTKVTTRSWSLEKFTDAVKRMGKRFETPIKTTLIKKAYDDKLSVRSAFERCAIKTASKKKAA